MTNEKMNVHRALSELKVIDARIMKGINTPVFVEAKKHSSDNIRGESVSAVADEIKSAYVSVNDLIKRRNAIKRAVVLSNAVTKVMIAGNEYAVAEAIDMKNHGLDGYRQLLSRLSERYRVCAAAADRENDRLEERADVYIKDMFGSTNMTKAGDEIKRARADFIAAQTVELVDPLNIKNEIEKLEKLISEFMVEVDSALSVSNAITEIEISY